MSIGALRGTETDKASSVNSVNGVIPPTSGWQVYVGDQGNYDEKTTGGEDMASQPLSDWVIERLNKNGNQPKQVFTYV